jgi:hypothetical protein
MTSLCWKSHNVWNYSFILHTKLRLYTKRRSQRDKKRTKLTSHTHTHTKLWVIDIDWGMIRVLIWKKACIVLFIKRIISCCSIYKEAWYHVVLFIKRLDIMLSEFCPDICLLADIAVALRCLRMGKINVITYKYVIKQNIW